MNSRVLSLAACALIGFGLAACGSAPQSSAVPTPTLSTISPTDIPAAAVSPTAPAEITAQPTEEAGPTAATSGDATMTPAGSSGTYPRYGHAPDYSWVAGQVVFTQIQGGCVLVRTSQPDATPTAGGSESGVPQVGTAVRSDTSPPLSEMTPQPPGAMPEATPAEGASFVPGGDGWDLNAVKDGDNVVLFGRLAGAGDAKEMCPGTHYVVERVMLNP